jgi:GTP-binding protein LepA
METQESKLRDFLSLTGLRPEAENIYNAYKRGKMNQEKCLSQIQQLIEDFYTEKSNQNTLLEYFGKEIPSEQNNGLETSGIVLSVKNPSEMPDPSNIVAIKEPFLKVEIIAPDTYTGKLIELINDSRGSLISMGALSMGQLQLVAELPLAEVIVDFYDKLKSISRGFASMSYEINEYKASDLVKIDIVLNGKKVDPLSVIRHREQADRIGRQICEKLKELIPRQQIEIAVQAAIGARVIARETIKPFRKDVTAKLYGGDITRRMKLLDKQKEGKKKMKAFGSVEVPKDVFINILKGD